MRTGTVMTNDNGFLGTVHCQESLCRQTYQNFCVCPVDDASTDNSEKQLQVVLQPQDVILQQGQSKGFAAACNWGIRQAFADGVDTVLLLNNDTVCVSDVLERLLKEAPVGAVSCPKMIFKDSLDEIWFASGMLNCCTATVSRQGDHAKDGPTHSQKRQVSFITCCCVLLPRAVIEKVGYLEEDLFMCYEDMDYCLCRADAGVPIWYIPRAVRWHRGGGTAGGMPSVCYITRNTLYLHCRGWAKAYCWALGTREVIFGGISRVVAALLGHHHGRSYGRWRGAMDFCMDIPERCLTSAERTVLEMQDLNSVVMLVYNCGTYLDDCLSSLLAQTWHNWAAILMDDGGTDDSPGNCDDSAKRELRVRVVHQLNQGVSTARNIGKETAKGRYLAFVDADDRVEPEYLAALHKTLGHALLAVCCVL